MNDLITALIILKNCLKKPETKWPTSCEHDILYVCGIDFDKVTIDIIHQLANLGFLPGSDDDYRIGKDINFATIDEDTWNSIKNELTNCFRSYRFGSC